MSLPVYQQYNIKSASIEEMKTLLSGDMNLKHPVVINLKALGLEEQREAIGYIENFYYSNNLSFKFPYPLYLVSDHEDSITRIPLVKEQSLLPKFYSQRDTKMNVKESHVIGKNKLLQMEIKNSDASAVQQDIENYAHAHKIIQSLEKERNFYRFILNRLMKVSKNG